MEKQKQNPEGTENFQQQSMVPAANWRALLPALCHYFSAFLPSSVQSGTCWKEGMLYCNVWSFHLPHVYLRESQCNFASWNKPWAEWAAGHPGLAELPDLERFPLLTFCLPDMWGLQVSVTPLFCDLVPQDSGSELGMEVLIDWM